MDRKQLLQRTLPLCFSVLFVLIFALGVGIGEAAEHNGASVSLRIIFNPYNDVNWETFEQHKANFHTHTTESDGHHTVPETVHWYHEHGYTVLAITDHDSRTGSTTAWPWTDYGVDPAELGMIAVEGNELSRIHHTVSIFSSYGGGTTSEEIALSEVERTGGLSIFAHPSRPSRELAYGADWYIDKFERYDSAVGLEAINAFIDKFPGQFTLWDEILFALYPERPVWGFGNDDMHRFTAGGRTWNVLIIPELSLEAVRYAVENGHFYFSGSHQAFGPVPEIASIAVCEEGNHVVLSVKDEDYTEIRWRSFPADVLELRQSLTGIRERAAEQAQADYDRTARVNILTDPSFRQLYLGDWQDAGYGTLPEALFDYWYQVYLHLLGSFLPGRTLELMETLYERSGLATQFPSLSGDSMVVAYGPELMVSSLQGASVFLRAEIENPHGTTYTQPFGLSGSDGIVRTVVELREFEEPAAVPEMDLESPVYARGLEFNGLNTYIRLAERFADVPNSFEFWFKVPVDVPDNVRVGALLGSWIDRDEDNNATAIELHTDGRYRLHWDKGSPGRYYAGHDARTGDWIHFAVVRHATGMDQGFRFYINGELVDSITNPGACVNPRDPSTIGGDGRAPSGPIFHGRIGEVRVWQSSRSQDEIQTYMNERLSGYEDGLLGYWPFVEGTGTTAYDWSPYQNHGTIHGAVWYSEE